MSDPGHAVLPTLGFGWRCGGEFLPARDLRDELWRIGDQLEAFDMILDDGRL